MIGCPGTCAGMNLCASAVVSAGTLGAFYLAPQVQGLEGERLTQALCDGSLHFCDFFTSVCQVPA